MSEKGIIHLFTLLLVGILIVAVGVGMFQLGQKTGKPLITTQTQSTPTPDPTATWETYTNTKLQFSLKYPPENKYLYDQTQDYIDGKSPSGMILIQNYDGSKPREPKNTDFQISIVIMKDPGSYPGLVGIQELFTIGGAQGVRANTITKYEETPTVFVSSFLRLYSIILTTPKSLNSGWFDQILSTFKFL